MHMILLFINKEAMNILQNQKIDINELGEIGRAHV